MSATRPFAAATLMFAGLLLLLFSGPTKAAGPIISDGTVVLVPPSEMQDLAFISASSGLNIGLRPDGTPVAWGYDHEGLAKSIDSGQSYIGAAHSDVHRLLLRADGSIDAYGGPDFWYAIDPPLPNSGFTAVDVGDLYSLALRNDSSVAAWGAAISAVTDLPTPNTGFIAIAAGEYTSYALHGDGHIEVWGADGSGQHDVPLPNSNYVAVSAGNRFAIALRDDGSLVAWGSNDQGALDLPAPNSGFTHISAGFAHALALRSDGSLEAWGWNYFGQLDIPSPNSGFTTMAAGYDHSVALRDDGSVAAWGRKTEGACGVAEPNEDFISVKYDLAIRSDGSLWRPFDGIEPPNVPAPNMGFVAIAKGRSTYALRDNGVIEAWGDNYYGELNIPDPNADFAMVSSTGGHALALRANGTIAAWGRNFMGQSTVPDPGSDFVAVAAGSDHSMALRSNGSVLTWGEGGAVLPPGPNSGFIDIAAGAHHCMALRDDGTIVVWKVDPWSPHLQIPEPNSGFVAIDATADVSLAMRQDGTVAGWGHGFNADSPLFGGCDTIGEFRAAFSSAWGILNETAVSTEPSAPRLESELELGAMPNPFNPRVTVWFESRVTELATIEIFDLRGRLVRSLWTGRMSAGAQRNVMWDGRDSSGSNVASGSYIVRLHGESSGFATRTVTLVK